MMTFVIVENPIVLKNIVIVIEEEKYVVINVIVLTAKIKIKIKNNTQTNKKDNKWIKKLKHNDLIIFYNIVFSRKTNKLFINIMILSYF